MKKINPPVILISWVVGCSVYGVIAMIILGITTPGGEQAPLTFLSKFVYIVIYGIIILSFLTILLFKKWSRKYWTVHVISISLCSFLLFAGRKHTTHIKYSFTSLDTVISGKKYTKLYEYYDNGSLRGISFLYNNKKDSVWTIYSENGEIISRLKYKEDTLIESIK